MSQQEEGQCSEDASAEATKAFEEIRRITNERLGQASRVLQALARGAPEKEVQAERQKYLEASNKWNADLKPVLRLLSDPEPEGALLSDVPSWQGHLTEAALAHWLRRRRRLKHAGTLLTCLALLTSPEFLLALC